MLYSKQEEKKIKNRGILRFIWNFLIFLILIGAIGSSIYFYINYKKLKDNPQAIETNEVEEVTNAVSKLMVLPEEEVPNIATVLNKDKLQDQIFFEKAENGDKVLIYVKARKAILYRPSDKLIINVAPLSLGNNQNQPQELNAGEQPAEQSDQENPTEQAE